MSNGYLVAAGVDLATLDDIAQGFGLDIIAAHTITDREAVGAALAGAPNIGIVLSVPGAREDAFVALLQVLATRLKSAQLILVEPDALRAFAFLPALWPTMSIEEAHTRAAALLQGRQSASSVEAPPPAAPIPVEPAPEAAPAMEQEAPPVERSPEPASETEQVEETALEDQEFDVVEPPANENADEQISANDDGATDSDGGSTEAPPPPPVEPEPQAPPLEGATITRSEDDARAITIEEDEPASAAEPEPAPAASSESEPAPIVAGAPAPAAPPPQADADKPEPPPLARKRSKEEASERARGSSGSAAADATAFAPKKLRRGEAELVRIAIHQPKDLQAVIKAARKADPRTDSAPQSMGIGEVALGASVGVALEVKGAACDGAVQRRTW
ncbi:MAG: hypothetical protein ABL883_14465, partial [Terricaulis sp.]